MIIGDSSALVAMVTMFISRSLVDRVLLEVSERF